MLLFIEAGGANVVVNATLISDVVVTFAEANLVQSAMEVAVTVTVSPGGTAAGALYFVTPPLVVDVGVKLPHWALPQVTAQFTPAPLESPAMVTARPV